MSDSFNVVRLTPERRERADRQRALASAYRLEAAVAHIPADVRPAVVQAVAKALKTPRRLSALAVALVRAFARVVGLENRNKAQGAGRRAVADFAVIVRRACARPLSFSPYSPASSLPLPSRPRPLRLFLSGPDFSCRSFSGARVPTTSPAGRLSGERPRARAGLGISKSARGRQRRRSTTHQSDLGGDAQRRRCNGTSASEGLSSMDG
jgi:hypothetical protein